MPTPHEIVATTPRIPGLEMHIPAGVVLRTYAGPLTALSITQILVDGPPFPLPEGTTFFFTPQGHGARVLRPDGSPSPAGIRMILPNFDRLTPGTRIALSNYDYGAWKTYGEGTVSADGRQILPDPGVEFHRLTCTQVLGQPVSFLARILGRAVDGDPVDLATGLPAVDKTDLALADTIPLVIHRQLRPGQDGRTYHTFQMALTGDNATYSYADLLLADGSRARYTRISPGTDKESAILEHTTTPTRFYKSRVTWSATRAGWDVTFPDGTVYEFPGFGKYPYGPQLIGVRDRVGNRLVITRHGSPSLSYLITRIASPNGRWVDVTQDTASTFVTQVRDNLGRTVSYRDVPPGFD